MSNQTTNWELRLRDLVSGPMRRLMDLTGGAQRRIQNMRGSMDQMARATGGQSREFQRNYRQLEDLLRGLQRRQAEAFNTRDIQAYQRMIERTRQEMSRLNAVANPPRQQSRWQRFSGQMGEAFSQIPGAGAITSLITNPAAMIAGAALTIGTATTKLAWDYGEGMAKINATAQLPQESLGKLKDRLKEIGSSSGGNFALIPDAYEKILSQTGKVNMSLDILETAVKGSKAGFTDIDTVAGALAKTMSIVGENNVTANQVMDTLLKAKAVGAGEFTDFANYMPGLIAAGKNLNITWRDTAGLFAYMTTKTRDAADATMLIKNAYTALSKSEIQKGMAAAGIKLFNPKGEFRRMDEIFSDLEKRFGAMDTKSKLNLLEKMGLKDAQAKEAFSILLSDSMKLKESLDGVNDAIGETNRQLEATGNVARNWGDVKDKFSDIGTSIGEFLIPVIDWLLVKLQKALDIFNYIRKDVMSGFKITGNLISDNQAQEKAIGGDFRDKFGFSAPEDGVSGLTSFQKTFLKGLRDGFAAKNDRNKIVDEDSPVKAMLDQANNGKSGSSASGSGSDSDGSVLKGTGSGSGSARSLTQNLYITIKVSKDDIETGNLKTKLKDIVVDAARDGVVTVGV